MTWGSSVPGRLGEQLHRPTAVRLRRRARISLFRRGATRVSGDSQPATTAAATRILGTRLISSPSLRVDDMASTPAACRTCQCGTIVTPQGDTKRSPELQRPRRRMGAQSTRRPSSSRCAATREQSGSEARPWSLPREWLDRRDGAGLRPAGDRGRLQSRRPATGAPEPPAQAAFAGPSPDASASLAFSATAVNAAGSTTARSASDLRSSSIPALWTPFMNWL